MRDQAVGLFGLSGLQRLAGRVDEGLDVGGGFESRARLLDELPGLRVGSQRRLVPLGLGEDVAEAAFGEQAGETLA